MVRALLFTLVVSTCAWAETPAAETKADKPRLVVNDFGAQGVTAQEAAAVVDAVVTYLAGRELFQVVGPRDVQTLLGAERQKQLLGVCENDQAACTADVSKMLNARFVLSGQLSKVGSAYQLTLQLVDTQKSQASSRSSRIAGSLEAIRDIVPYAASEATGSPLPPPPSRILPITLLVAGGAAVLAGGAVEVLALSREAQLNEELCPGGVQTDGRCTGVSLRPRTFYLSQQQGLTVQKVVGIGVMAAGVILVGLGVWLLPPDDARTRISLRLSPTPGGFAFSGGF